MLLIELQGGSAKLRLKALLVTTFILFSCLQPLPANAQSRTNLDAQIPGIFTLDVCHDEGELDCVESVGVFQSDGSYTKAFYSGFTSDAEYVDWLGNTVKLGFETWTVTDGGLERQFRIRPNAETPSHAFYKDSNGVIKRFGSIRTWVDNLPSDYRVQIALRTSWIRPLNVALYATHANFTDEKITDGHLWTFTGGTNVTYGYQDNESGSVSSKIDGGFQAKADIEYKNLVFIIDHAGATDELSPYPTLCSDSGYTAESSNASSAGMPFWDGKGLSFAVFAPHLTTGGELNSGFFEFWSSTKYLDCKWPKNNLSTATNFEVSIIEASGVQIVKTSGANVRNGIFHLWVDDYHYSSPVITVEALPDPKPRPTQTPYIVPTLGLSGWPGYLRCKQTQKPHKIRTFSTGTRKTCPKGYKRIQH